MNTPTRNLSIWRILLLCFILSTSIVVHAQVHSELTSYKEAVKLSNKTLYSRIAYDITIFSKEGSEEGEISIPFSPILKVGGVNAWITDKYGNVVVRLQKKNIVDRNPWSSSSFYSDYMVKEFTMVYHEYPYMIHCEYETKETDYIDLIGFIPYLSYDSPTKHAEISLTIPNDMTIKTWSNGVELKDTIVMAKDKTYLWVSQYDKQRRWEPNEPSRWMHRPFLRVSSSQFYYENLGDLDSWSAFGAWQYDINQTKYDLPQSEILKAQSVIKGISDTLDQIKALYHYVQDETTYVNISTETGGLVPHPASYVARNKYGDCKALTIYFLTLLKNVGIHGNYCKIKAGSAIEIHNPDYIGHQSNHIIAQVPLENDTLWLDCTSKGAFGQVSDFIQNRTVLVVKAKDSYLDKTPSLTPKQVQESRVITISQDDPFGEAIVECKRTLRGSSFDDLHSIERLTTKQDKDRLLKEYFVLDEVSVEEIEVQPYHRDSFSTTLTYKGTAEGCIKKYGNDWVCRAFALNVPFKCNRPDDRVGDYQVSVPFCSTDTTEIVIQNGLNVSVLPENISIENEFGHYDYHVEKIDNRVRFVSSVLIQSGIIKMEDYQDFYTFLARVRNNESKKVVMLSESSSQESVISGQ